MAIADESLLAFGYRMMSSWDTAQVIIDLYVMALLAIVWMYKDCKSRNKSLYYWMTFTFLTLVFVSIGPLLYLSLRPSEQQGKVKA
jgi:hypothetical protein